MPCCGPFATCTKKLARNCHAQANGRIRVWGSVREAWTHATGLDGLGVERGLRGCALHFLRISSMSSSIRLVRVDICIWRPRITTRKNTIPSVANPTIMSVSIMIQPPFFPVFSHYGGQETSEKHEKCVEAVHAQGKNGYVRPDFLPGKWPDPVTKKQEAISQAARDQAPARHPPSRGARAVCAKCCASRPASAALMPIANSWLSAGGSLTAFCLARLSTLEQTWPEAARQPSEWSQQALRFRTWPPPCPPAQGRGA